MDTRNGSAILVLVQTASGPNVYTSVASQMGAKFSRKGKTIDVSDKSIVDNQYLPGDRDSTITLDSIYVPTDAGVQALKASFDTGATLIVERQENGVVTEYATCFVSSIDEDFQRSSASKYNCVLQRTGAWTPGAAP
ncbi:MAG: phage tail tube protein [Candidatus Binatus sp.]